jgi:hypothetical protein
MFFTPHPPYLLGIAICDHLNKGMPEESFLPYQRNWNTIFMIFERIHFGIFSIEA